VEYRNTSPPSVCKCHGNYEYTFVYKITIERKNIQTKAIQVKLMQTMTGILGSLEF